MACQIKVDLFNESQIVSGDPKKTLLESALDAGLYPPYACQEGYCGTCRALLIEGQVDKGEDLVLTPQEREAGYILTCQCSPKSAFVHVLYD